MMKSPPHLVRNRYQHDALVFGARRTDQHRSRQHDIFRRPRTPHPPALASRIYWRRLEP